MDINFRDRFEYISRKASAKTGLDIRVNRHDDEYKGKECVFIEARTPIGDIFLGRAIYANGNPFKIISLGGCFSKTGLALFFESLVTEEFALETPPFARMISRMCDDIQGFGLTSGPIVLDDANRQRCELFFHDDDGDRRGATTIANFFQKGALAVRFDGIAEDPLFKAMIRQWLRNYTSGEFRPWHKAMMAALAAMGG